MSRESTDRETEIYRRNYDTALSDLLSAIWGGHLHMGVFESATATLLDGQMRANRILAAAADPKPGDHVLEVACGIGGTARYLARAYGVKLTATNIAETQLAEARAITEREGLGPSVTYQYADYHHLPFADGSFDIWWCQEALLYSVDKPGALNEAFRVVKPGGRVIFSDLTLEPIGDKAARDSFAAAIRAPGLWSQDQWRTLVDTLPVTVLLSQDWSPHVATTFQLVRDKLMNVRAEFTSRIGAETVDGTVDRVTRQLDAARDGRLGCIAFAVSHG